MKKSVLALLLSAAGVLSVRQARATIHNVGVGSNFFAPASLPSVAIGDTVRWQWIQGSHNTVSTNIPAGAAAWSHPMNNGSTTFDYVPTVEGTYNYTCTFHANQDGSFIVTAGAASCPPFTATTNPTGNVTGCSGSDPVFQAIGDAAGATYTWLNGITPITGATEASFTPNASGSYSVMIMDSCGNMEVSSAINYTQNTTPVPTFTMSNTGAVYTFTNTTAGTDSYVWNFGDGSPTATTSPVNHTYTGAGPFTVTLTVTSAQACAGTATQTFSVTLGLSNISSNSDLHISPNPAGNQLSVNSAEALKAVRLFDFTGKVIVSKDAGGSGCTIDLSSVPSGLYLLEVQTAKGSFIAKQQVIH